MFALILILAAAGPTADRPAPTTEARVAVPVASERAMSYYRTGVALWWLANAWRLAVPAVVLFTGLSARMRTLAFGKRRGWVLGVALFGAMYVVLAELATLPLSFYLGYVRPHEYGLSTESLGGWFGDWLKALGVSAGLVAAGLWMPYIVVLERPRAWPFLVAAGYVPVAFALMFLAPIAVDPLFDRFGPMKDRALEAKILALADRAGIEDGRVFEVDKSRETTTINAYVKGFAGSKRIVLWDTLLKKLDERQALFVMGHEMGHYALGHVARTLLLSTVGVLAACLFLKFAGERIVGRLGSRFGFSELGDVASLPLAVLLGGVFVLATAPIGLAYSRHQEHEADRFALELTRDNFAGASAFAAMQRENLSNPRPGRLSVVWRSTHPPLGERIEFCNAYRPWEGGGASRYAGLFRSR